LPDPASLGVRTKGKTCIGCWITGQAKTAAQSPYFIYNVCVHEECYAETGAQAISYTTGVPAALGAKMILSGQWSGRGVFNMEQFDPDPFIAEIGNWGLPWIETFPAESNLFL
jgi:saccharopine dehydrogenase (NAD+, L-lysine-forming)